MRTITYLLTLEHPLIRVFIHLYQTNYLRQQSTARNDRPAFPQQHLSNLVRLKSPQDQTISVMHARLYDNDNEEGEEELREPWGDPLQAEAHTEITYSHDEHERAPATHIQKLRKPNATKLPFLEPHRTLTLLSQPAL
ncbi:hypothetical protein THAOC_09840 [Thalassiosira oceanica]|uniref:Uncharacterized protein n=1 Tax=Thalassiosira oceanica TaxID=159749 RepID=K0T6I5_THAOC|nr:hypothetical protein THAOC_09840 [Thalassiosira oceanica]|eukprot:EJK68941.1 hypothetical protein THAOC_09840 [Thalassiosira oceanica]